MRPPDPPPREATAEYLAELRAIGEAHGITHVGVAPAEVLHAARAELHRRKEAGLHDGMAFTYKDPDRSTDPGAAVRGARSVIVAARPYLLDEPDGEAAGRPPVAGRVARYAWTDHYAPLRAGLWAMARQLRADRWKAVAFADDNSMVDREVARLAGIGWPGKNANLLVPGAGSWFVLGSVVTTAPFAVAERLVPDGCGTCRRCLDGCPTGAIVAPGVVDAGRCLAWLVQKPGIFDRRFRVGLGDRMYGCDDCQEVCPPSVRLGPRVRRPREDAPGQLQTHVDVLALLEGDDDVVMAICGRWYLADRDPRWLRRNALLVLGNTADARDPLAPEVRSRVEAALRRYLADRDPVLRAHAVWAARRLGRHDLLPVTDPDPDVRAELTADPDPR